MDSGIPEDEDGIVWNEAREVGDSAISGMFGRSVGQSVVEERGGDG